MYVLLLFPLSQSCHAYFFCDSAPEQLGAALVKDMGKKFSATFDCIGCVGEIELHKDKDHETWAINSFVKFPVAAVDDAEAV